MHNPASYMLIAMEKDAILGGRSALGLGRAAAHLRRFARNPIKSMMGKRVPLNKLPKAVGKEIASGALWSGGIAAGGIAASPFILDREI